MIQFDLGVAYYLSGVAIQKRDGGSQYAKNIDVHISETNKANPETQILDNKDITSEYDSDAKNCSRVIWFPTISKICKNNY